MSHFKELRSIVTALAFEAKHNSTAADRGRLGHRGLALLDEVDPPPAAGVVAEDYVDVTVAAPVAGPVPGIVEPPAKAAVASEDPAAPELPEPLDPETPSKESKPKRTRKAK